MIQQELISVKIMRQCPRFIRCSVPICPLDIFQDLRDHLAGEPRCTLAKAIRYRIGKDAGLPRKGLTKKEYGGLKSWLGLDATAKADRNAILSQFGFKNKRVPEPFSEGSTKVP